VPDKENAQHFTGTKKCAGTKIHKGACADWVFVEAEPPERAAEQLPFVKCSADFFIYLLLKFINQN